MHLNMISLINLNNLINPTTVNQPLEVIVTDQQCTMTFSGEQVHICEEVILPNQNQNQV